MPALEIEVEVERRTSALSLTYIARGDIAAVSLSKQVAPARADGLWQHTCFEAFLRSGQSTPYREFNFSPSREWAAYRFYDYRQGMTADPAITDPHIDVQLEGSELRVSATLDLADVAGLYAGEDWQVALSAIIEAGNGDKLYWALAHPPGKPDFHHADGFVLHLPPG